MPIDSIQSITHSIRRFFSGTLISRVAGLLRDISMASIFGSHPSVAAFLVAFRLSHLLRRLLGEGAMQSAFIPLFEEQRKKDDAQGFRFFRDLLFSLTLLLLVIVFIGEGALWGLLYYGELSADNREIISLLAVMWPSILFICLFGINASLLQCEQSFFIPAVAPLAFNGIWILSALLLAHHNPSAAMPWLSGGIVFACLGQWLVTLPPVLKRLPEKFWSGYQLFSRKLRQMSKALLLGIIGVGAVQINSALDYLFARYADLSGPAYLWYALRIQQLPIGLFGVALAGALLPPLSRAIKKGDTQQYREFLDFALRRGLAFIVPFSIALLVGSVSVLNLLYGRGSFDANSLLNTTWCLWGYALGMLPAIGVMVLAPSYYAQSNYRTPTLGAVLSVCLNIALNALLVFGFALGPASVAVATSVSALWNCLFLMHRLPKESRQIGWKGIIGAGCKIHVVCVCAAIVSGGVTWWFFADPTVAILMCWGSSQFLSGLWNQLGHFLVLAGVYGGMLMAFAWLLGEREIPALLNDLKNSSPSKP